MSYFRTACSANLELLIGWGNVVCLNIPEPNVGAGLLANAVGQSAWLLLTHRYRGLAPSHMVS